MGQCQRNLFTGVESHFEFPVTVDMAASWASFQPFGADNNLIPGMREALRRASLNH